MLADKKRGTQTGPRHEEDNMAEQYFKFLSEHPWLGFFLTIIVLGMVYGILHAILFRLPNRIIRHLNILQAGWPPPHLDADGDFKTEDEA